MTEQQFQILNRHLGYGNRDSQIVFLGLEEAAPDNIDELNINLNYRYNNINNRDIIPLNEFHLAGPDDMNNWFLPSFPSQRSWNKLAHLMLIYQGAQADEVQTNDKTDFVNQHLGQFHSNTLLLELYPIPRNNHNFWHETFNVQGRFNNLNTYIQDIEVINRINSIRDLLLERKSRSIIVYGKSRHRFVLEAFNLIGDPLIPNGILSPRIESYILTSNENIRFYFTPHTTNSGQLTIQELEVLAGVL